MKSLLELEHMIVAADALASNSRDCNASDAAGDEAANLRAVAVQTSAETVTELAAKARIIEGSFDDLAALTMSDGLCARELLAALASLRADAERLSSSVSGTQGQEEEARPVA